jgi:hypothetical protein
MIIDAFNEDSIMMFNMIICLLSRSGGFWDMFKPRVYGANDQDPQGFVFLARNLPKSSILSGPIPLIHDWEF